MRNSTLRRRRGLSAVSDRTKPLRDWRDHQGVVVAKRALGRCECSLTCRQGVAPGDHHVFMRGNVIGEPLCSWAPLRVKLSQEHHDAFHADPAGEFAERIRRAAIQRAILALPPAVAAEVRPLIERGACGVDQARQVERALRDVGFDVQYHAGFIPLPVRRG